MEKILVGSKVRATGKLTDRKPGGGWHETKLERQVREGSHGTLKAMAVGFVYFKGNEKLSYRLL